MPARAVEQQDGMGVGCNMTGDFFEMKLHGFSVSIGQGKTSAFALGRTDGSEEIGIGVALVSGLSWSCTASGPLPDDAVLLANAGFILEPDFDDLLCLQFAQMAVQRLAEVFLKAAIVSVSWPGCCGLGLRCEKCGYASNNDPTSDVVSYIVTMRY